MILAEAGVRVLDEKYTIRDPAFKSPVRKRVSAIFFGCSIQPENKLL